MPESVGRSTEAEDESSFGVMNVAQLGGMLPAAGGKLTGIKVENAA